jgi:signal transduction histidine kinase
MKKSLRRRIYFILTGSIIAIIIFYWALNSLILEDYYISKKKHTLVAAYMIINKSYNENVEDMTLEFEKIDKNKNVDIGVRTREKQYVYSSNGQPQPGIKDPPIPPGTEAVPPPTSSNAKEEKNSGKADKDKFDGIAMNFFRMETQELLEKNDNYSIEKVYDDRLKSSYIFLTAQLDNGYYLFLRTPLESINESVNISNQFLIISGVLVSLISAIIMYIISRNITKPIMDLSSIAQSMANFDFTKKYTMKTEDEIDVLGESINTLSEQLEQKISELKLANIELRRDLDQKLKIDEMRKDFLSNVSHELKTPIALIQGYAEGLQDNIITDDESRKYYLEVIMDEADKMNIMVRKLLTLNQLEFGKDVISVRRFDIVDMIKCLLNKSEILTASKDITLSLNSPEKLYVWADEFMIEEVFMNYITNALNHIAGEKAIDINVEENGEIARISVSNTGSHIPEDELDKVWISFYKVDKARTREYGGSGIGLSVVKAAMDLHKQKYGGYNTEEGITFWFELDCSTGA